MESTEHVSHYYRRPGEDERLNRHQLEWDMTWRHLQDVLPPAGRMLEVGCATGRYSLELARRGYEVVGLDLAQEQLNLAQEHAKTEGLTDRVTFAVGDAQDLSLFEGESFDAVLLLGPLYHLQQRASRERAIREAQRVLLPGGIIGSAFVSRYGMLGSLVVDHPEWVLSDELEPILRDGWVPQDSGFPGYFATYSEAIDLHEKAGFTTRRMVAVEAGIGACDKTAYTELSPELQAAWLDVLYRISTEPIMLGSACHWLYLGSK